MLVARDESGQLVNLLAVERQQLNKLAQKQWYCPACQGQVQLKKGRVKHPHFAHLSLLACQGASENESVQHLELKKRLYDWLCRTEEVKMEQYLPELQQTPDLLVNDRLAIEIQCSPLPLTRLRERTSTYQTHGYTVLWLMGKDLWLGESLTELKQNLLNFSQHAGFYYWELDLAREKIRLLYLLSQDLTGRLHYLIHEIAFDSMPLISLLRLPFRLRTEKLTSKPIVDMDQFFARQLHYRHPKWLEIQAIYYEHGQNLLTSGPFPHALYPLGLNILTHPFIGVKQPDFCQISSDFKGYYTHFLNHPEENAVYPPIFYDKIER